MLMHFVARWYTEVYKGPEPYISIAERVGMSLNFKHVLRAEVHRAREMWMVVYCNILCFQFPSPPLW